MGKTLMIIILPIRLDGVGFLLRHESYSKLQMCPLIILYSFSANSPSKQQGGRHIVIRAMDSVDSSHWGGAGLVGNRRPGSYIWGVAVLVFLLLCVEDPRTQNVWTMNMFFVFEQRRNCQTACCGGLRIFCSFRTISQMLFRSNRHLCHLQRLDVD